MLNKKIVNYYLDSEMYFYIHLLVFFSSFGHIVDCIDDSGIIYEAYSSIAAKTFARKDEAEGFYICEEEVPEWLVNYYNIEYSDEQLFAIVFGAWWGLSKEECHMIANRNRRNLSWKILNCFLCGMTCEEVKSILNNKELSSQEKENLLSEVEPAGMYEICKDSNRVIAEKQGEEFIDIKTRKRFVK